MGKSPIVFETEASLWEMLADGSKTWDARRYDSSDERIRRLVMGHEKDGRRRPWDLSRLYVSMEGLQLQAPWEPDEHEVSFLNKTTGEVATYEYLGMEFTLWAPGWCFIKVTIPHS